MKFSLLRFFSGLSFSVRLYTFLVAPEEDESEHQEEAENLFAFLLPLFCFLGCAVSPTLTFLICAHCPLFTAGTAPSLGSAGSLMQHNSIYHSACGCWKKRRKDQPSLYSKGKIHRDCRDNPEGANKSIFIFHY